MRVLIGSEGNRDFVFELVRIITTAIVFSCTIIGRNVTKHNRRAGQTRHAYKHLRIFLTHTGKMEFAHGKRVRRRFFFSIRSHGDVLPLSSLNSGIGRTGA